MKNRVHKGKKIVPIAVGTTVFHPWLSPPYWTLAQLLKKEGEKRIKDSVKKHQIYHQRIVTTHIPTCTGTELPPHPPLIHSSRLPFLNTYGFKFAEGSRCVTVESPKVRAFRPLSSQQLPSESSHEISRSRRDSPFPPRLNLHHVLYRITYVYWCPPPCPNVFFLSLWFSVWLPPPLP